MNDLNNLNQQALDGQAFQAQQQALNQQSQQVQQGFAGQQIPYQQNQQIPQYQQPAVKTKSPKSKKKGHITAAVAGSIAAVILVAGGAGFGGAYFASSLNKPAIVTESGNSSSTSYTPITSDTPTLNEMQQNISSGTSNVTQNGVEFNSDGSYAYTRDLVAAVKDSIVFISNYVDDGYQRGYSLGSGIIISTDGYIITNNHIISEDIKDCDVTVKNTLADGTVEEK